MDERIHIARLKAGDLTGLEKLVTEYQVRAVHAAWLIVYDRALAEEIAQSAFIKAAERIGQYDESRPFAPWFFRIVINDALKAARKQKRQLSLDDNLADLGAWLVDPGQSPEQIVAEKELSENIVQALQQLPPEQRAVIVMRYYLALSAADMSVRLDRPVSTIKWCLRTARQRLVSLLET